MMHFSKFLLHTGGFKMFPCEFRWRGKSTPMQVTEDVDALTKRDRKEKRR